MSRIGSSFFMSTSQLLNGLYYALWLGQPALQLSVAAVLRRRKLDKEFRFFFWYLIFQGTTNLLMFALMSHYREYFYAYWFVQAPVSTLLELAIIYEIFGQLFRPYPHLRDFAGVLFRWAGSVLVLVAVLLALNASGSEAPVVVGVLWAGRSARLVQCGLVFFLLWFCSYLGITRRHYLFGVALGFGTIASTELAALAARTMTGYIGDRGFNVAVLAAADFAAVIWLIYLRARAPAAKQPAQIAVSGQSWDQGVAALLYPEAEPGLLASIDKMVEKAMVHAKDARTTSSPDAPAVTPPPVPPPRTSH